MNSKITMFAHFQEYHRNREKKIKSLIYGFGAQSQHDLLYGGVSLSISLKFETRPSSLRNFEMGN